MAYEDWTIFTEQDPGSTITIASGTQINCNSIDTRNTDSLVYYDYGASFFNGDFIHKFRVYATSSSGSTPYFAVWGLANTVDDFQGIDDASGDYQSVVLVGTSYLQLRICENGSVSLQNVGIGASTMYYVTVERDDDGGVNSTGQLTLRVCTGNYYGESGYSELAGSPVTVDCAAGEQNDFQYLHSVATFNTGDTGRTIVASVYDLDIGTAEEEVANAIVLGCNF